MSTTVTPSASGWRRAAFVLLLIWGLTIRVWYASVDLNAQREGFIDEMYNLGNVRSILDTGSLEPVTAFYGSLSYLPQAATLAATRALGGLTGSPWLDLYSRRERWVPVVTWDAERVEFVYGRQKLNDLSPLAFFLCRLFSCLYGVAALAALRDIGTRLFSPAVGLISAFLLAVLPVHIHMSGIFKPDALLVLATLLALRASLRALDEPTTRNYLVTGGLIGLATASKLSGGVSAAPLIVATFLRSGKDRRVWLRLSCAGLVAVGIFLITNPDLAKIADAVHANLGVYGNLHPAMRALGDESSRLVTLRNSLWLQLDPRYFGRLVGAIGLVGLAAWPKSLLHRRRGARRPARLAMVLSLFAGYAIITAIFSSADASIAGSPLWSVFLPVAPTICLAAAWLLQRAREGIRGPGWRPAFSVLVSLILGWSFIRGPLQLHRQSALPTSSREAARFTAGRLPDLSRSLVCSELERPIEIRRQSATPALLRVESLEQLARETLDFCDAELYRATWLNHLLSDEAIEKRAARFSNKGRRDFLPSLFKRQSPGAVVLAHPWRLVSRARLELAPRDSEPGLAGNLQVPTGSVVSMEFRLPPSVENPRTATLTVGDVLVDLHPGDSPTGRHRLTSSRFATPSDPRFRLRVQGLEDPGTADVHAYLWRHPRGLLREE